jgi:hypothetical protein
MVRKDARSNSLSLMHRLLTVVSLFYVTVG